MPVVELGAGRIVYVDRGPAAAPVIVFAHGLIMDASVWDPVVDVLAAEYRCIAPTLPLGAHPYAMRPGTDRSFRGIGRILSSFVDALDLRAATLVVNDCGLAMQTALDRPERIARLVLTPCEAFDNLPPGLPGALAAFSARLPGGISTAARSLRLRYVRELPPFFGWMAKRPLPGALFRRWTEPALRDPAIRADLRAYTRDGRARADLRETTRRLATFDRPALVLWSSEDRIMPRDHGARLAALMPHARLETVDDSYVLMQRDRPDAVIAALRAFVPR